MNSGRFVWGVLVLVAGLILLGISTNVLPPIDWSLIFNLWPILLIILGVRMITKNDLVFILVILAALGFAWLTIQRNPVVPVPNGHMRPFIWRSDPTAEYKETLPLGSTQSLVVELDGRNDIQLIGGTVNDISVSASGPESQISGLELKQVGDKMLLRRTGLRRDWFGYRQPVDMSITLPEALALDLKLSGFSVVEGQGLAGKLSAEISGATKVALSNSTSTDPDISLSGAGMIQIDKCQGSAKLDLSGAGQLTALDCQLADLKIDASGAGKVEIKNGTIANADIDASGAGTVTIPKPTTIKQDASGAGKINLK